MDTFLTFLLVVFVICYLLIRYDKRTRELKQRAFNIKMRVFNRKRDQGYILIAVLIIVFLMMYLSASLLRLTLNDMKLSQMAEESSRAFYAAEAGLEKAYLDLIHTERSGEVIWEPNPEKEYIYSEEGDNLRPAYFEVTIE